MLANSAYWWAHAGQVLVHLQPDFLEDVGLHVPSVMKACLQPHRILEVSLHAVHLLVAHWPLGQGKLWSEHVQGTRHALRQ